MSICNLTNLSHFFAAAAVQVVDNVCAHLDLGDVCQLGSCQEKYLTCVLVYSFPVIELFSPKKNNCHL